MNAELTKLKYWTTLLQRLCQSLDDHGVADAGLLRECEDALGGTLAGNNELKPASVNEDGKPEGSNSPNPTMAVEQVKSILRSLLVPTQTIEVQQSDSPSQTSRARPI
jgi:hypothetical protein